MIRRVDRAGARLRFAPTPVREDPHTGYKTYRGVATMGDVVLEYRDERFPGGVRREFRPREVALAPEAVATLLHKVLTPEHPDEFLTLDNTASLAGNGRTNGVGAIVTKVDVEDDDLVVEVTVYDRKLDDQIQGGLYELSPGYQCGEDPTPGEHPTEGPYHVSQTGPMAYNHLSAVGRARTRRASGEVARLDQDDLPEYPTSALTSPGAPRARRGDTTMKLTPAQIAAIETALSNLEKTDQADEPQKRSDMLSEEDAKILLTMSPEAQKMIAEAMAKPAELEVEAEDVGATQDEEGEEMKEDMPKTDMPKTDAASKSDADRVAALEARLAKLDAADRQADVARQAAHDVAAERARVKKVVDAADPKLWDASDLTLTKATYVTRHRAWLKDDVKAAVKRGDSDSLDRWFEETSRELAYRKEHADRRYAPAQHADAAQVTTEQRVVKIPSRKRK